jgi:hypothetical protein
MLTVVVVAETSEMEKDISLGSVKTKEAYRSDSMRLKMREVKGSSLYISNAVLISVLKGSPSYLLSLLKRDSNSKSTMIVSTKIPKIIYFCQRY